jgi:toxin ParE1/3/4
MALLRLSHLAKADIEDILLHSHAMFGVAARRRYEALIEQALRDISADPNCAGVRRRDDLRPGLLTYHLANSRRAARSNEGTVRAPRHLILFRIADLDTIDVARLLHDSIPLPQHVPD